MEVSMKCIMCKNWCRRMRDGGWFPGGYCMDQMTDEPEEVRMAMCEQMDMFRRRENLPKHIEVLDPYGFDSVAMVGKTHVFKLPPEYSAGDFTVFRYLNNWHMVCLNNIVVLNACGIPKQAIDEAIVSDMTDANGHFLVRRMMENYAYGLECAHQERFEIKHFLDNQE